MALLLAQLAVGDDDLLWLHVTFHVAFYGALAVHVGIVVRRRVVGRMLPWVGPAGPGRGTPISGA